MPIYVYKCEKCDKIVQRRVLVDERNSQFCDICGHELRKMITSAKIKFVGDGFYSTDNS